MTRSDRLFTGLAVLTLAAALAVAYSLRREAAAPVTTSRNDGPLGEETDDMKTHQEPAGEPAMADASELGGAHADA